MNKNEFVKDLRQLLEDQCVDEERLKMATNLLLENLVALDSNDPNKGWAAVDKCAQDCLEELGMEQDKIYELLDNHSKERQERLNATKPEENEEKGLSKSTEVSVKVPHRQKRRKRSVKVPRNITLGVAVLLVVAVAGGVVKLILGKTGDKAGKEETKTGTVEVAADAGGNEKANESTAAVKADGAEKQSKDEAEKEETVDLKGIKNAKEVSINFSESDGVVETGEDAGAQGMELEKDGPDSWVLVSKGKKKGGCVVTLPKGKNFEELDIIAKKCDVTIEGISADTLSLNANPIELPPENDISKASITVKGAKIGHTAILNCVKGSIVLFMNKLEKYNYNINGGGKVSIGDNDDLSGNHMEGADFMYDIECNEGDITVKFE